MKKVTMSIQGMHCASCSANVEKSLMQTPGVKCAKISLLLNKGTVEIEDNVTDEDLKRAVARAGYKVSNIRR